MDVEQTTSGDPDNGTADDWKSSEYVEKTTSGDLHNSREDGRNSYRREV